MRDDIRKKGLLDEEVYDRVPWMHISSNIDPALKWNLDEEEEDLYYYLIQF